MKQNTTKIKYILYARKSTESEDRQVLSIDSQIDELKRVASRDNLHMTAIMSESKSAKSLGRPVFQEVLDLIIRGEASGILCWKLDRLARNFIDGGKIIEMIQSGTIQHIRTFERDYYPQDNVLLMSVEFGMANQYSRDLAVNVSRGMRRKAEMGWYPVQPPLGYLNSRNKDESCHILVDQHRAPTIRKVFEKVAYERWSGRRIFAWLKNEVRFKTKGGKPLSLSNIYILLRNHFYYGTFEYPRGSNQWYQGKHTPIITKELFDKAQENISEHLMKTLGKEFAFTKIMICGLCSSGISADEKFKKQNNGNIHRYVYYGCAKFHDKNCKCGYIREEDLIEQLANLMDKIDLDEISIKERIKTEIERHKKFQSGVLGIKEKAVKVVDIDIRNYAKYLLREGTIYEKRELLSCLRSKITLKNKQVMLAK